MLITLGLGSSTGYYCVIIRAACDHVQHLNKTLITILVLSAGFLVSSIYVTPGGQQILQLVDFFSAHFVIIALAILEVAAGKI